MVWVSRGSTASGRTRSIRRRASSACTASTPEMTWLCGMASPAFPSNATLIMIRELSRRSMQQRRLPQGRRREGPGRKSAGGPRQGASHARATASTRPWGPPFPTSLLTQSLSTDTLKLVQWHRANMEYANACPMDSSLITILGPRRRARVRGGAHCAVREEQGALCAGLARPLRDVRLQWPVSKIERVNNLIVVTKENSTETLVAEVVVVTVP